MKEEPKQSSTDDSTPMTPKIPRTPKVNKDEIVKKLVKMFRAASNGRKAYQLWFPEENWENPGDFEAAFISELNKLVK